MTLTARFQEEHYLFAGVVMTILISGEETGGRYALLVSRVPAGHATPPHLHDIETEISVVLKGALTAETNGVAKVAQVGEAIQFPSGHVHRLLNAGETAEAHLLLCAPAGFEQFVRAVSPRVDDPDTPPRPLAGEEIKQMVAAAATFGIHFYTDTAMLEAPGPGPIDTALAPFEALGHRIDVLARVSDRDEAIAVARVTPMLAPGGAVSGQAPAAQPSLSAATLDGGRQGLLSPPPQPGLLAITTMRVIRELQEGCFTHATSEEEGQRAELLTRLGRL
ncbi:cupin domain-containing protein [Sphingomonas sp.]|uniref:cupin domain-containing protein n=1 Tax=Sphingomonas sp. TaxID=28214 RepID=UPI003B3AAC9B